MNDNGTPLIPFPAPLDQVEWDPGFEGDRRIVRSRLGPYVRVFKRPTKFIKRFYHTTINIPVTDWAIPCEVKLLGGLCTVKANLKVRFQATIKFVQKNIESIPDIAAHIRTHYESLLKDVVERELLLVEEGRWIQEGLETVERAIENTVNETLAVQNIQCRASCDLEPRFDELSPEATDKMTGLFRHQAAYIELMRRNHEFQNKRNREVHRQEQQDERVQHEHLSKSLELSRRDEQLRKVKEKEETERVKAQLSEEEKRQFAVQASEERRHAARIRHEKVLRGMEMEAKTREREMRLRATQKTDEMLRREVELLVLEKQRDLLEQELDDGSRERDHRKLDNVSVESEEANPEMTDDQQPSSQQDGR